MSNLGPPPIREQNLNTPVWQRWFNDLRRLLTNSANGLMEWDSIDKTGSDIRDIQTRNHSDLQDLNTDEYSHLTAAQVVGLTTSVSTTLHKHDHNNQDGLQGGTTSEYYHITATDVTNLGTLTGSGATTLHKHDHSLQDNLNSASYYHLTQTERTDILGASYIVLGVNTSLTSERVLTLGSGFSTTDGGAGSTFTINQYPFVGDSGTGGVIGAVPAPSAGDGDVGNRKYLCADGTWRAPQTSADIEHNSTTGLEGGIATNIFEATAFESTAFQTEGVTEYFHVTEDQFDNLTREGAVTTVSIDTTMTDDYATYLVDTTAVTLTLPTATINRIGKVWTAVQTVDGYMTIIPDPTDEFILFGDETSVQTDVKGSTISFKCVSNTQWVLI